MALAPCWEMEDTGTGSTVNIFEAPAERRLRGVKTATSKCDGNLHGAMA